jgi:hypothetical protein
MAFKKKGLKGRKMQRRQDHWRKENNSHSDLGAAMLMLYSTPSDETVS